jgi:exodeoxyribonuclease VII large subunit
MVLALWGLPAIELLVIARGGGSIEDLWAFNEEVVARAIAGSVLPVISAIGHEIDFTIADFVADLRAPTPSAAAELIVPEGAELRQHLAHLGAHLRRSLAAEIARGRSRLDLSKGGALFREPRSRLDGAAQQLDAVSEALRRIAAERLRETRRRVGDQLAALRQHRPDQMLAMLRQHFACSSATNLRACKPRSDAASSTPRSSRDFAAGAGAGVRPRTRIHDDDATGRHGGIVRGDGERRR